MYKRSIFKFAVSAGVATGIGFGHVVVNPLGDDIDWLPKVSVSSTATGGVEVPIVMKDKWVSAAPAPDKRGPNVTSTLPST